MLTGNYLIVMLRNRSRAVTTKQATKMADHTPLTSPIQDQTKPISSFFGSPKLFSPLLSPTSTLDAKPFFPPCLCGYNQNMSKLSPKASSVNNHPWEKLESKGIGLALISSPNDVKPSGTSSKQKNRMVVFGTHLTVQIPALSPSTVIPIEFPISPSDFGIKTRNPHLTSSIQTQNSPQVFPGCLSVTEMELSEDYTCVISHGPHPKTTHIFDNCVLKSCYRVDGPPALRREPCFSSDVYSNFASESFLSFCYTCKKKLGPEKDIYIYRGEKAFCSAACRSQEMLLDGLNNSEFHAVRT